MSNLSGYDSEVVGFDSVSLTRRPETSTSTQTTEFGEGGVGSQTTMSQDCGSMTSPDDLKDDIIRDYPPAGLNEFLRRVVPSMMEQLDENKDMLYNSSDSEEDDMILAKMFQEIKVSDVSGMGGGDPAISVLALSWSSAGNSLAVSVGRTQHENWCTHDGLIRIYTVKHTSGDKFVHLMDINEKNCISVLKYHPSVAALLAYGTTSGEVVICDLRNATTDDKMSLSSPSGCHGSKRVSSLKWADAPLANTYLTMQINTTGKRRSASDQILISTGSDGTMIVWQVNYNLKIFESVMLYNIDGMRKMAAPDISCFDFIKAYPLRPCDEKVADDVFVVGSKSGSLFLCKVKPPQVVEGVLDPVSELLDGHATCVLDVSFTSHKPGIFVSVSIDSEMRLYDINQASPLKVFHIESPVACISWLPTNPCVGVLGLAEGGVLVYNVSSGRKVPVEGMSGGEVTAVDVNQSGSCRIACGDADSRVRVWELPSRRIRFSPDDLEF